MTTSVPSTKPPGDGWRPWSDPYGFARDWPYNYCEVEIWRRGDRDVRLVDPHVLQQDFNIAGLWWRAASPRLSQDLLLKRALEKIARYGLTKTP